ncbi:MAG TPA: hypothetical protein VHU80_04045 [Polyangiaceae bacterium]|jgi:hypothetical protein|nr:hypothetical protein [Polyangiaceae bacterium]
MSYEAKVALAAELAEVPAEDRTVPWTYYRRGRAALLVVAVLGLAAFFAPWVNLHRPDELVLCGYDLARLRGTWFFGSAIGWFVMIPLVLTRRTIYKMRGVRIITAMFAALSVVESGELLLRPPHGSRFVPLAFDWGWGLYATLALGVIGVALGARFGGRNDDIDARELLPAPLAELNPEESDERTLH